MPDEERDEEEVKTALEELRTYLRELNVIVEDPAGFVRDAILVLEFFTEYMKKKEPRETATIVELDQAAATLLGYVEYRPEVDLEDSI